MCLEKVCTKCGKLKSIEEFSFKNKAKGIRRSQCKECISEYDKKRYSENKNDCLEKIRKNHTELCEKLKLYILSLKLQSVCQICGESRWYVLDFHHIKDKEYNISDLIKTGCSVKKLIEEINKCILVCANCHREIHYKNLKMDTN